MISLHRDPHGKTILSKRTFTSEPLSQVNSSRKNYVQQIEILRKRVRELESHLNQPCNSTQSPREREFQLKSINPCCMQQERGSRSAEYTQDSACYTGDKPPSDDVEPTEMAPPGECQEISVIEQLQIKGQ